MKKRAIIMIGLLILLFTGCGKQEDTSQQTQGNDAAEENAVVTEFGKLCLTLPGEFQTSTTDGLYLNPNYPDDPSNIYLYTAKKDPNFPETMQNGQQAFVDSLVQSYQSQYNESPEVTVFCYRPSVVGQYNAYEIELTYTLQGVVYHQLEYIIDAEQTYFVAFTQAGSGNWMEAFYTCASGMYFTE